MVEISTESRNLTVPAQLAGVSRKSRCSRSGRIRNRPGSASTRVSLSSADHPGWVKSPVPSTRRPLRSAHQDRCSMSQSLLQARENLEWMCRSAWNMAGLILPRSTDIRPRNSRVPGARATAPGPQPVGQVMPSTWWTTPQSTPSAAWCLRIASSSGPSSRQYTWPSGLWYSSTCRTPNWSARSLRVSSAICAMASDGSLRSAWKSMNRGMSVLLRSDRLQDRVSQRADRPAAGRAAPLGQHRRNRREERGHDRYQGDLPARHAAYDHGADHGDRSGAPSGPAPPPPLPGTGTTDVDAKALLAKLTAMTARLASTAPSRLRLLMVLMEWFSLPGFPGRGLGRP